jgi:hypothetical protein
MLKMHYLLFSTRTQLAVHVRGGWLVPWVRGRPQEGLSLRQVECKSGST